LPIRVYRRSSAANKSLSRVNFDLDHSNCRLARRHWRPKMEFQGFFQIRERLICRAYLTGYVGIETLRDIPVAFTLDSRWKGVLHAAIL
jgi:hypothetical protein